MKVTALSGTAGGAGPDPSESLEEGLGGLAESVEEGLVGLAESVEEGLAGLAESVEEGLAGLAGSVEEGLAGLAESVEEGLARTTPGGSLERPGGIRGAGSSSSLPLPSSSSPSCSPSPSSGSGRTTAKAVLGTRGGGLAGWKLIPGREVTMLAGLSANGSASSSSLLSSSITLSATGVEDTPGGSLAGAKVMPGLDGRREGGAAISSSLLSSSCWRLSSLGPPCCCPLAGVKLRPGLVVREGGREAELLNRHSSQALWLCIKLLVQDFILPGIFIHEECHKVQENHSCNHF